MFQQFEQVLPRDRIKSLGDGKLDQRGRRSGSVIGSRKISDIEEVVLNAFFFMKALWQFEIILSIAGATLRANTFITSLAKECIKLIGR